MFCKSVIFEQKSVAVGVCINRQQTLWSFDSELSVCTNSG